MPIVILILSVFCIAFSLLPFHNFEVTVLWQALVVLTNYGHLLFVFPLGLAALGVAFFGDQKIIKISLVLCIVSAAMMLRPAIQAMREQDRWQSDLREAFGPADLRPVHVSDLWLARLQAPQIAPRSAEYAPSLMLDFYPAQAATKAPWVLVLHGGGWSSGARKQLPELNSVLATKGMAVFDVEYHLAPKTQWPAQLEDVSRAVEFIKKHATEYDIDPDRWVILGRSAGGQIAQVYAYKNNDPSLRGLISFYAPTDMKIGYEWGSEDDLLQSRQLIRDYMGGPPEQIPDRFIDASPLALVTPYSPPTLLLHGTDDWLVWYKHSERLIARLKEMKVKAAYIEIPGATHGFDYNLYGPGGLQSTFAIEYFLKRVFAKMSVAHLETRN